MLALLLHTGSKSEEEVLTRWDDVLNVAEHRSFKCSGCSHYLCALMSRS